MLSFEKIADGLYFLRAPFSTVFTGITLVGGKNPVLIDSGADADTVDRVLIPALDELGVKPGDLAALLCTHCHGDHAGGHHRLTERFGIPVWATEEQAPKLTDPLPYAVRTRSVFPEYSPRAAGSLPGVPVSRIIGEGALPGGRLTLLKTPGHDTECVSFLDRETGTLITGDSLQGNGTGMQGLGFYKDLPAYRATLDRLASVGASRILPGHLYDGLACPVEGANASAAAIGYSRERVGLYGAAICVLLSRGVTDPAAIARELIARLGCGQPPHLFMALYTVTEHLKELHAGMSAGGKESK